MQTIKYLARIGWVSLLVAWLFDFLFWQKAPGISFFIFVTICIAGGLSLTWMEGLRPAATSLILLIPAIFFSAMTFLRLEPFSIAVSILLTLAVMAMLADTLLGGQWPRYSLADDFAGAFRLVGSTLSKPATAIRIQNERTRAARVEPGVRAAGQTGAVFRGVALTIPVVGLLAALLASADPVFGQGIRDIMNFFHVEKLGEYIVRGVYILAGAYLLAGVYLHALVSSREQKLIGVEKPWLPPFLGWTETAILLASVDILFAAFVGVQFRYFFGGQANINLAGFTYAEYAQRGFGELVSVAFISLLLVLGLGSVGKRETAGKRRAYNGLVVALVGLVLIMLVSAVQRLLLYEGAYGFTRLRTYTHMFIPWLGVLLIAVAVMEVVRRPRGFALAALVTALGFGATLNLINVDGFIARQNIQRAVQGEKLDVGYLSSLSGDAVPVLVEQFHNTRLPENVHNLVGAALACRARPEVSGTRDSHWQSFNLSWARSQTIMEGLRGELKQYNLFQDPNYGYQVQENGAQEAYGWLVQVNGAQEACGIYGALD